MTPRRSLAPFVFPLLLTLALGACRGTPSQATADSEFQARPGARRFDIDGKVLAVDSGARRITLAHGEVKGFMAAMTMPFTIKERWAFDAARPGDVLRGTLVVDGARSWIEGVSVTRVDASAMSAAAAAVAKGTWAPAERGTPLPEAALIDQDGRVLSLSSLKGRPLLVTFSYTRCPLEEYCPLMMQRFAAIERATAADPALRRVRLLTVTLDPEHDTPERLKAYGSKYYVAGVADRRWTLATGAPAEVKKLARFFGLDYYTETTGQVIHSLRTGLVDREGRVVQVFESNTWRVDEVLRALGTVTKSTS